MAVRRLGVLAGVLATGACGTGIVGAPAVTPDRAAAIAASRDPGEFYRQAGFVVGAGDLPFIGSARAMAGASPDSTLVVLAFSLANRHLTFAREAEAHRAVYDVTVDLRMGPDESRRVTAREEVRVASMRETTRAEESVIFQQILAIPPGPASIDVTVRDAGSTRVGRARVELMVPRFGRDGVAAVPAYHARPRASRRALPDLTANPRATAVFGRDSLLEVYVEAYDLLEPYAVKVQVEHGGERLPVADTVPMVDRAGVASGVARLPVARLGLGVASLVVTPLNGGGGARVPIVVTFGEGLAIATYDEMLGYLRYFAADARLERLRAARPAERVAAWSEFVRATDPDTSTPEHEALRSYFERIEEANRRFAEGTTSGWLTPRGMVYVTLGAPSRISEGPAPTPTDRAVRQVWEYDSPRARLMFEDEQANGTWVLAAASEAEFRALAQRVRR